MAYAQNSVSEKNDVTKFLEEHAVQEHCWQDDPELEFEEYIKRSPLTCVPVHRAFVKRCNAEKKKAIASKLLKDLYRAHDRFLLMDNGEHVRAAVYLFIKQTFGKSFTDQTKLEQQAKKVADYIILRKHAVGKADVSQTDLKFRDAWCKKCSMPRRASGFGILINDTPHFITNSHLAISEHEAESMMIQTSQPGILWKADQSVGLSFPTHGMLSVLVFDVAVVKIKQNRINQESAEKNFFYLDDHSKAHHRMILETSISLRNSFYVRSSLHDALVWSAVSLCFAYFTGNKKMLAMLTQCSKNVDLIKKHCGKLNARKNFANIVDMTDLISELQQRLLCTMWLKNWIVNSSGDLCSLVNCAFHKPNGDNEMGTRYAYVREALKYVLMRRFDTTNTSERQDMLECKLLKISEAVCNAESNFYCCEYSMRLLEDCTIDFTLLSDDLVRQIEIFYLVVSLQGMAAFELEATTLSKVQFINELNSAWMRGKADNARTVPPRGIQNPPGGI